MIGHSTDGRAKDDEMAMIATLYDDGRAAERHSLEADATVRGPDQIPIDVLVADLSLTGCLFLCTERLKVDAIVTIGIAGIGRRQARVVRAEEPRFGCVFATPLSTDDLSTALAAGGTIAPFPPSGERDAAGEKTIKSCWTWRMRLAAMAGITVTTWALLLAGLAALA